MFKIWTQRNKILFKNKIARNEEKIETNKMCLWAIAFICFDFLPNDGLRYPSIPGL